jgi:hypothetical protein
MNDAIQQRVERFVREILDLLDQASGASRAAALNTVSTMLRNGGRASAERLATALRMGSTSRKAASPRTGQLRRRGSPVLAAKSSGDHAALA